MFAEFLTGLFTLRKVGFVSQASALSPLPDTRHSLLLRLGRREDEAAWREFLAVYEAGVYRHARRRGLQDSDARDVVQQVLVAVYAKAAVWQPGPQVGAFRAWLMRTTHNITVDCLRTRLRGGVQDAEPVDEAAARSEPAAAMSADDDADRHDWERWAFAWAADIVRGEVAELTWEAFRRTPVEGRPPAEVATTLGLRIGSVYTAKCRVMGRVKELVAQLSRVEP